MLNFDFDPVCRGAQLWHRKWNAKNTVTNVYIRYMKLRNWIGLAYYHTCLMLTPLTWFGMQRDFWTFLMPRNFDSAGNYPAWNHAWNPACLEWRGCTICWTIFGEMHWKLAHYAAKCSADRGWAGIRTWTCSGHQSTVRPRSTCDTMSRKVCRCQQFEE